MEAPHDPHAPRPDYRATQMVGIGSSLAVGMALFPLLGYYFGNKYDRLVLGILVGVFFGLFFCGYEVWKMTRTPPDTKPSLPSPDQDTP